VNRMTLSLTSQIRIELCVTAPKAEQTKMQRQLK